MPTIIRLRYRICRYLLFAAILIWLFTCLTYAFPASNVHAATYPYFIEDFDQPLDPEKWLIDSPNGCSITHTGETIILDAEPLSGRFPYVTTNQMVFPEGDSSTEISFRFLNQATGTGIAITDTPPPPIGPDPNPTSVVFAWPLPGDQSGILTTLCPEAEPGCTFGYRIISTAPINPLEWQKVKIDFVEGQYRVYIDDNPDPTFTSAPTDRSPKHIWLGNPQTLNAGWSALEVDYIHIERLIGEVTFDSLIQDIKLLVEDKRFKNYLVRFTKKAQNLHKKPDAHHVKAAKTILSKEVELLEKMEAGGIIDPETAEWLVFNLQTLIDSL